MQALHNWIRIFLTVWGINIYILRNCLGITALKKVEQSDLGPPYNTYISVSKPTPWAVASPHGQQASNELYVDQRIKSSK